MFGSRQATPGVEEAVSKAVNYEVTVADLARRSERRAWYVAFAATTMALILAAGYFYMLPLKEKVPFLVMADAQAGTAAVARLDEDFRNRSITASEAINRSQIAHFVTMRESYDVAMMNLRDWRAVHSMSSPEVGRAYGASHAPNNPDSPFNTLGRNRAIRVAILSIVLLEADDGTPQGATVRFQRSVYDNASGATRPLDSKIATLGFTYNLNLKLDDKDRIENPLGFQVTSYRVDSDFAPSPPLASEASPFEVARSGTGATELPPAPATVGVDPIHGGSDQ